MSKKVLNVVVAVLICACFFVACEDEEKVWEGDFDTTEHGYSVDALKGYTSVTGKLLIYDTLLENVDALSSLEYVGSSLIFSGNSKLKNIDGLSNLIRLGGKALYFTDNESLQNVDGIKNIVDLQQPELTVYIEENDSLTNVDGYIWLKYVDQLEVYDNPSLENIDGLKNVDNIRDRFYIIVPNICQSELDKMFENISYPDNILNVLSGDDGC